MNDLQKILQQQNRKLNGDGLGRREFLRVTGAGCNSHERQKPLLPRFVFTLNRERIQKIAIDWFCKESSDCPIFFKT